MSDCLPELAVQLCCSWLAANLSSSAKFDIPPPQPDMLAVWLWDMMRAQL